jgi:hypothetical protein
MQYWRSSVEAGEAGEVIVAEGREWVLWDLEILFGYRYKLPGKMRRSIELFLYDDRLERDTAVLMGVRDSNPVATYATVGITKLLALARSGNLPECRYRFVFEVDGLVADRQVA